MSATELSPAELALAEAPHLVTEVPGPNARAIVDRDAQVTSPSLPRAYPFAPARGSGCVVEDVDGNRFLDLNAGIAVTGTGHCHPRVVEAIQRQAERLLHYSASDFFLPIYSELCERLGGLAPMSGPTRTFLSNSGTEAVEAAMKLARHATGRPYLIGMFQSFHGRTYGSVSLTASKAKYRTGFAPLLPGIHHTFFGDREYLVDVLFKRIVSPDEVAAIILEPVLGEGGYVFPPAGWLRWLRDLCDEHGILLVDDEVQAGVGRTGRMWAIEHEDVEPDILIFGKGIASGMPLGGITARADLMGWSVGAHGSTYGGNPVACAAALATLDLMEESLMANARAVGERFVEGLRGIQARHPDFLRDVRGRGLMIGLGFPDHDASVAVEIAAFHRGLLVLSCGDDAVRMAPPLVMREEQVDVAVRILGEVIAEVAGA